MERPLFRPEPALPVGLVKTYGIRAPRSTHTRAGTCAEVDCEPHRNGWATTLLAGSDDVAFVERVCRGDVDGHRRQYTAEPVEGGFVRLTFPPGQVCFRVSSHRVPLERPPIFEVRGGDHRGNPVGDRRVHTRPEDWVDDFATHQDRLAGQIERG